jgi:hypothetical protein
MDRLTLWARQGAAVRQAIELGERAPIETASAELTDACQRFAIDSGRWKSWAGSVPDPCCTLEYGLVMRSKNHHEQSYVSHDCWCHSHVDEANLVRRRGAFAYRLNSLDVLQGEVTDCYLYSSSSPSA